MENYIAFIMSNMAHVSAGDYVYDPFGGTAGLLLPALHFGAIAFGSDLDSRVLHGTGVGRINP